MPPVQRCHDGASAGRGGRGRAGSRLAAPYTTCPPIPPPHAVADFVRAVRGRCGAVPPRDPFWQPRWMHRPRLRVVARHGVGVDDVDLAAAAARGIVVTRAPGSNTPAVAEHTMAMILASRQAIAAGWRCRPRRRRLAGGCAAGPRYSRFAARPGRPRFDRPGRRSALAGGLRDGGGMACGPQGARRHGLWPDCSCRDPTCYPCIVPYMPATHHLVDAAAPRSNPCRAGSFVINTSRGGLIDEAALLEPRSSRGHRLPGRHWMYSKRSRLRPTIRFAAIRAR